MFRKFESDWPNHLSSEYFENLQSVVDGSGYRVNDCKVAGYLSVHTYIWKSDVLRAHVWQECCLYTDKKSYVDCNQIIIS